MTKEQIESIWRDTSRPEGCHLEQSEMLAIIEYIRELEAEIARLRELCRRAHVDTEAK